MNLGNGFLDMTHVTKKYINSWTSRASKDSIKKAKGQATEWEKHFAKYICDKRLVSRLYEKLLQHNQKTTQFKKWAKELKIVLQRKYIKGQ